MLWSAVTFMYSDFLYIVLYTSRSPRTVSTSFSIQPDLQGQLFCARLLMDLVNKWICGIAVANASYPFHTLPKHYNIVDEIVPIDKSAMSIVRKICLIPPQDIHLMFLVPYPCE